MANFQQQYILDRLTATIPRVYELYYNGHEYRMDTFFLYDYFTSYGRIGLRYKSENNYNLDIRFNDPRYDMENITLMNRDNQDISKIFYTVEQARKVLARYNR